MILYSRAKLSDLYTLSQRKLLENHTLHSGTYLYSPYMAVPPPPGLLDALTSGRCEEGGRLWHLWRKRDFISLLARLSN